MKTLTIDRAKWRCGGDALWPTREEPKFKRGLGVTELLNEEGFMCCLGFACNQLGKVQKKHLMGITQPEDVSDVIEKAIPLLTSKWKESVWSDTDLSTAAIEINDDKFMAPEQREKALSELFKSYDIEIVFKGDYHAEDAALDKDPKRVAAGKRARRKGNAFENAVNRAYRFIFGDVVYRGDQSRKGGSAAGEGADNEGTPFWSEAKHRKSVSIYKALEQAEQKRAEAGDVRPIVIVTKVDRKPIIVSMRAEDWFDIIEEWHFMKSMWEDTRVPDPIDWLGIINGNVK